MLKAQSAVLAIGFDYVEQFVRTYSATRTER